MASFGILYEDEDVLVVDKPPDLLCHPASSRPYPNLIQLVREYLKVEMPNIAAVGSGTAQTSPASPRQNRRATHELKALDPTMVHRLDRETSGIVIVAKTARMAGKLGKQIQQRAIEKEYQAIVRGFVSFDHGVIEKPIGRDTASPIWVKQAVDGENAVACVTEFQVELRLDHFTVLRLRPRTGRMHQLRVHLASIGHPIVGDKIYGSDEKLYLEFVEGGMTERLKQKLLLPRQALHASHVKFFHPWRNEHIECTAPLPDDLTRFIREHQAAQS